MSRNPYTGGELNILNGKKGISAPQNSVPVMKIVRYHKPKSAAELEYLVSTHQNGNCICGAKSKGSVVDFGRNLYNAQLEFWGENKFSLNQCIQWEYDLFILQSLKGTKMEDKCKVKLGRLLGLKFNVKDSNQYVDEDVRVDLEVLCQNTLLCGIQVKPISFKQTRETVIKYNIIANKNYEKPVFYVYYDYDTEKLINIQNVVEKIIKISSER